MHGQISNGMEVPHLEQSGGYTKVEGLWFEDGNLILLAETSLFRIYSGILSARSSVFKDMFGFPPPAEGNHVMEGCPLVHLYDSAEDTTYFLKAILDSGYFEPPPSLTELPIVAGVLRLSTKYDVQYLRTRAMQHLLSTYPTSLEAWKERDKRRTIPCVDNTPFAALNLAREFDFPWLLPSIVYCISSHPIEKTLDGASWAGAHLDLNWEDKRMCVIGRSSLLVMQTKNALAMAKGLGENSEGCTGGTCAETRLRCAEILTSWGCAGFLDFLEEHTAIFASGLCSSCHSSFKSHFVLSSQDMWNSLPTMLNLPRWEELERQQLLTLS